MLRSTSVLSSAVLERYAQLSAPFGFNGLGEFVFNRTYSRPILDPASGELRSERWHETVERVVQGTSDMLVQHKLAALEPEFAEEMYDAMFNMRFLPPGRGLWAMGTKITNERHLYAALNNCAFTSTADIKTDPARPFAFLFDASMLGIGVGFDTRGEGTIRVLQNPSTKTYTHVVADSREGWVEAYKALVQHYTVKDTLKPIFDFSLVRPAGAPIHGFGGVSGGPQPLIDVLNDTTEILESQRGKWFTSRTIVDLMNLIGKAVVSGNVRRTAEIAFGRHDSDEFLNLKNYKLNPERANYGWTSNNSIFAEIGMDYNKIAQRICDNGEPGLIWLQNMRNFSRMNGIPDFKDEKVMGSNPCVEQTLESGELCCLVETFPLNCRDINEWLRTLKLAFTYAKIVTLGETPWQDSNEVMARNRRIGTSMSGIEQFVAVRGRSILRRWCHVGYDYLAELDQELSAKFGIPMSIKRTSIKPSGTVSLLAGATPGVHCPISPYYIRRVRVPYNNPMVARVMAAGYHVEPDINDANTAIVSFPIFVGDRGVRSVSKTSIWDQFEMAAFMQEHWADNSVSCTVTLDVEKEGHDLAKCLEKYQYRLKGISVLPNFDNVYPQMPYESITMDTYNEMCSHIQKMSLSRVVSNEPHVSEYCDGDSCTRTIVG